MKKSCLTGLFATVIVLGLPFVATGQSKEQREKIDRMAVQLEELKTEVMLLQRQVQSMHDTFNKTMGELNTLVVQMSDNIATIRRGQSSISTGTSDTVTTVTASTNPVFIIAAAKLRSTPNHTMGRMAKAKPV